MGTTALRFWTLITATLVVASALQPAYSKQPYQQRPPGSTELDYLWKCETVTKDALYDEEKGCYWNLESGTPSWVPMSPAVRPSGNNRAFVLIEPMEYEVGSTGLVIKVPAGFVTDYASIPQGLWSLYSPHDQYSRAAAIHDYLYWSQLCTRLQADNLFMIAMQESDVPVFTRDAVYIGVRAAGDASWNEDAIERKKNWPRVVPVDRKDFPPNWTWERYRRYLVSAKVTDPVFVGDDYCALGNSTNVPYSAQTTWGSTNPAMVQRPTKE